MKIKRRIHEDKKKDSCEYMSWRSGNRVPFARNANNSAWLALGTLPYDQHRTYTVL